MNQPVRDMPMRRSRGRRAFTLVELVTAASLMTVMMLGVVQIFAIVTQAAGDARGIHFAQEQGRAALDCIGRDIRGLTRDGYMRIIIAEYNPTVATQITHPTSSLHTARPTVPGTAPSTGPILNPDSPAANSYRWYARDTLAFVSVGPREEPDIHNNNNTWKAAAAEVVYTGNVQTPNAAFRVVTAGSDTSTVPNVDARRGILGRGVWVLGGFTAGAADDWDDRSAGTSTMPSFLCNLVPNLVSANADRIAKQGGGDSATAAWVRVSPFLTSTGAVVQGSDASSANPWTLRRVLTCCTSEFLVEYLDTSVSPPIWTGGDRKVRLWDTSDLSRKPYPRAIRVTIAIHSPDDQGGETGPSGRYEGYAIQEVFFIGDS